MPAQILGTDVAYQLLIKGNKYRLKTITISGMLYFLSNKLANKVIYYV